MSNKDLSQIAIFFFATLLQPFASAAENVMAGASFENTPAGETPGQPWKTRAEGENTNIERKSPPGHASKNWIRILDHDGVQKVYLQLDIPQVTKGELSFKLYFPTTDGTIGIFLRSSDPTLKNGQIVEFKTLEGSGNIYVGSHGDRSRLPITVAGPITFDFDLEFEATDAGELVSLYVNDDAGRHLIHQNTVEGGGAVDKLMIATDTKTSATEVYIGDIEIKKRP
ncbi:hypothetical protein [Rubellicoccus peritrichatus]|uniref:Uncharacterized protein n=1 Tax=Rubellicoccus peritrichatus TaxID=3080537 RepID=A0AAQ3L7T3_9BACT|nr:hypothetical protein [Puniceicoccus sp. CR14]WOO41219.1 hypothetical protein RZN69_21570 [Puniceicoccus sp. CR14]